MRPVVKELKQEGLMYTQNMVAKIIPALTQRVAKLNHVHSVNYVTEGTHQVTPRGVTWWLPRNVGEMV